MVRRSAQQALFALLPFVAACGSSIRSTGLNLNSVPATVTPTSAPTAAPAPSAAPEALVEDPVHALIAASDRHFKAGQEELELDHVEAAKQEFTQAIDVLLASPYGRRAEPWIREQLDRLVDLISAYEVKDLAEEDRFAEKKYEPTPIDEPLAISETFTQPTAPTPELKDAVQTDIQPEGYDIPIPLNRRVLSYIELFQGRLHEFIEEGMRRGSKYLPMIQGVFRAEGLPLDLAYVPLVESAFKPNALSRAKAKGVWQFMRGTGLQNGLRQDWYIDERSDPEKATVAAAKYLGTLAKIFGGDWHLALASYNGGPGRLQRAIKVGKQDDFWKLSAKPRLLPRETREYVPMILAAIVIARNPARYGFDFEPEALHAYDKVTLPRPVDLRRIAEWTGTTIDEIQALNPELRRWTTPLKDTDYELKVPVGTTDHVNARLDEASTVDLASVKWHTVKRGETLAIIAKKLGVSRRDLAEANYLKVTARVTPGQQLMAPHEATVLVAARTDRPVPVADSGAEPAVLTAQDTDSNRVKVIYRVQRGDTLGSIARLFKTSVESLQTWNHIRGTQIRAGERLTIYKEAN